MTDASGVIVVFARFPRLGLVKTRLLPLLGAPGCLELHRSLLADTLERLALLQRPVYLYLSDCSAETLGSGLSFLTVRHQTGTGLGERLWNAFQEVRLESDRILFLGIDSPSLPLPYVAEALVRLADFPVVIGPALDGGYYLLGLSEPKREIFERIDWGTPSVLSQTVSKLKTDEYFLLPEWYDIDTVDDLKRLNHDLENLFEGYPQRTRRFLDQIKLKFDTF